MDIDITRYDIFAHTDVSYDDGHIDYVNAFIDYCESKHGDWVRAEDIDALIKRIKELEAANRSLRYNQADDYFEPMGKFSGDC